MDRRLADIAAILTLVYAAFQLMTALVYGNCGSACRRPICKYTSIRWVFNHAGYGKFTGIFPDDLVNLGAMRLTSG